MSPGTPKRGDVVVRKFREQEKLKFPDQGKRNPDPEENARC
jgi:hypothetical protein